MTVAVTHLTTFAHVLDLDRSIAFYGRLGFTVVGDWEHEGERVWAQLQSQEARLMISLASEPIDEDAQAVLFYCYTDDVSRLRNHLLDEGLSVPDITHPDYMPHGELRLVDPDGYILLIGQLEPLSD